MRITFVRTQREILTAKEKPIYIYPYLFVVFAITSLFRNTCFETQKYIWLIFSITEVRNSLLYHLLMDFDVVYCANALTVEYQYHQSRRRRRRQWRFAHCCPLHHPPLYHPQLWHMLLVVTLQPFHAVREAHYSAQGPRFRRSCTVSL